MDGVVDADTWTLYNFPRVWGNLVPTLTLRVRWISSPGAQS